MLADRPDQECARRAAPRHPRSRGETGASLILALIFSLVVSLVIVAVANWAGANLRNTSKFTSAHSIRAAANNANEIAVQYVRYNFIKSTINASPPVPCWPK